MEFTTMDKRDSEIDLLYESIRKELNSIINDSNSKPRLPSRAVEQTKGELAGTNNDTFNTESSCERPTDFPPCKSEELSEIEASLRNVLLEGEAKHDIDADIKKMQVNLRQSYELFHTICDKFEAINFLGLKNRIKDLHLDVDECSNESRKAKNRELRGIFEEKYAGRHLDSLTADISTRFQKHAGEFGDIPELSAFFQACSQLQHGLESLKRQRNDANELGNCVNRATKANCDRIDEIGKIMSKDLETEKN